MFSRSPTHYETLSEVENDLTLNKNRKNNGTSTNDTSKTKLSNLLELKERLSLSKGDQRIGEDSDGVEKKCARVVKNLNEFLSFSSLGRNRIAPSLETSESSSIRSVSKDDASPDDITDYFPMTTSMTRKLRLELESLDRQVFGPSPPNEQPSDLISRHENNQVICGESEPEVAKCSSATDVFVWENPLHSLTQKNQPTTPDEQADIEYDGEIFEDRNGVKSVTPIRLLKRTPRSESASDSEATDSWPQNDNVTQPVVNGDDATQEQCEEATEITSLIPESNEPMHIGSGSGGNTLPPPHEFGCGNPFLMFLCITLLLQHRDFVMRNQMDYNEMAMHFDKMVRRHNVHRVLNQARQLFAGYLKRHSINDKQDFVNV